VVDALFRTEEKEFLLTWGGQSVMNRFTASGFGAQSCVCVRWARQRRQRRPCAPG